MTALRTSSWRSRCEAITLRSSLRRAHDTIRQLRTQTSTLKFEVQRLRDNSVDEFEASAILSIPGAPRESLAAQARFVVERLSALRRTSHFLASEGERLATENESLRASLAQALRTRAPRVDEDRFDHLLMTTPAFAEFSAGDFIAFGLRCLDQGGASSQDQQSIRKLSSIAATVDSARLESVVAE